MDRQVDIIVERFQFGPLVLIDNVFDREGMDFKMFLEKAKFVISGRIAVKPYIRIAAAQKIDCRISTCFFKAVTDGTPNS